MKFLFCLTFREVMKSRILTRDCDPTRRGYNQVQVNRVTKETFMERERN